MDGPQRRGILEKHIFSPFSALDSGVYPSHVGAIIPPEAPVLVRIIIFILSYEVHSPRLGGSVDCQVPQCISVRRKVTLGRGWKTLTLDDAETIKIPRGAGAHLFAHCGYG